MGATGAWREAAQAARSANVELRPLTTLDDADRILDVMIATWGEHQLLPREVIRALADSGNVPYGAFADDRLVGYVLGWVGVDDRDGLHVHSHMLAALPERRSRGVGFALKLAQRAQALERGIALARWTFDPLVSRNAHFNLGKLGAVCDRFHRNYYGEMTDALNRGDRSDRLVVRWDLARPVGPRPLPSGEGRSVLGRGGPGDPPRPDVRGSVDELPPDGWLRVDVPWDYAAIKQRDPRLASAWRDAVADVLQAAFAGGLCAVAFAADRETRSCSYALARAAGDPSATA